MVYKKMSPLWGFFFKDRYRVTETSHRMSLAEILFIVQTGVILGWLIANYLN